MTLLRHCFIHHRENVFKDMARQQICSPGGIGRAVRNVALAAIGMAEVRVDREYIADKPLAPLVDDELDRVVRAEHVASLERNVPCAADIRHFLEAFEREA